jgi:AcrR family transcriptional regulator
MRKRARTEAEREGRMQDIRAAALDVFSGKGFAAARLEDVARAAGVAKGTIYLYFKSKEDLFEAIVNTTLGPLLETFGQSVAASPASASVMLRGLGQTLAAAIEDADRRRVLHLVLSEGARFPAIADFYHREIISRGMKLVRALVVKGCASGEFHSDELAHFPQLVVAPALAATIWAVVFDRIEKLDARAMLDAHFDLLIRALRTPA